MRQTICQTNPGERLRIRLLLLTGILVAFMTSGCQETTSQCLAVGGPEEELANRAYIVSLKSEELVVIDLDCLEIVGRIPTGGRANHMAELNADFSKIYVDSSDTNETIVVDAQTLQVVKRISVGAHPTHLSLSRRGNLLAIMNEDDSSVSFIDTTRDLEVKRLEGFETPHFLRFAPDGRYGYVANITGDHITRVDLESLEIDSRIPLDGFQAPSSLTKNHEVGEKHAEEAEEVEDGFADAQIDSNGILYAAHNGTGRLLVYDTLNQKKLPEIQVGLQPWIAFAEHPFPEVPLRHLVTNFGDQSLSLIDGSTRSVVATLPGDEEAYGVNFTPKAPNKAFVMNRVREDIAVVDTEKGEIVDRIPVGGNTETASTTPDGKWIIAAVSSANKVVVIDAVTHEIVKSFEDVGQYPWSVTIPNGQNYCH